ncbi:hypothetical protein [Nocardia terpenica]|uniref:Lipoprotein n=1 Tax=Nocardia terpenica TaxID=455432 RepID=A0A164LW18_9NOCA|nr:hypothetical protein [Nocardia terpenica]KZM72802.1 hypothetical protein AWN90_28960 [Nocardia terpenica]NQE92291.1 hypothetical protein [Nocardia terpenica]
MTRIVVRAVLVAVAACAAAGCVAAQPQPRPWAVDPDLGAIDGVVASPATAQLAGAFLRSQDPSAGPAAPPVRRTDVPVVVFATDPRFATAAGAPMSAAGVPAYLAVPVRVGHRNGSDTLQLAPDAPYTPRAVATGTEEAEVARSLTPDSRLLLDYPSHTWFRWTETRVTALRSGTDTTLAGRDFDAEQFERWLRTR